MSGPTSNPDWNKSGSPAYGTFPQSPTNLHATLSNGSSDSTAILSGNGDEELSPTRRPSPQRKPSRHIEFRKYLKRPYQDTQRTLSDALRSAKSRQEQETLLPEEDYAGSDGCFNGQGQPAVARAAGTNTENSYQTYFNIHRYAGAGDALPEIGANVGTEYEDLSWPSLKTHTQWTNSGNHV